MLFNVWSLTRDFRIEQEKKRIGECINGDDEFFFERYRDEIASRLRIELEPKIRRELTFKIRREMETNEHRKKKNDVPQ